MDGRDVLTNEEDDAMNQSKSELSGEQVVGCMGAFMSLFLTVPIWLVLLFGVLSTLDAVADVPTWIWVLYWVYVPVNVCCTMILAVSRHLLADKP